MEISSLTQTTNFLGDEDNNGFLGNQCLTVKQSEAFEDIKNTDD